MSSGKNILGYGLYVEGIDNFASMHLDVNGFELVTMLVLPTREEARRVKRELEDRPENGKVRIYRLSKDKQVR